MPASEYVNYRYWVRCINSKTLTVADEHYTRSWYNMIKWVMSKKKKYKTSASRYRIVVTNMYSKEEYVFHAGMKEFEYHITFYRYGTEDEVAAFFAYSWLDMVRKTNACKKHYKNDVHMHNMYNITICKLSNGKHWYKTFKGG